jgi:hypothetical protein
MKFCRVKNLLKKNYELTVCPHVGSNENTSFGHQVQGEPTKPSSLVEHESIY